MTKRRRARCVQVIAGLLLSTTVVSAKPGPNGTRLKARALYNHGEERFAAGDFAGAEHAFKEAYETLPKPVVLLRIAECQKKLGDLAGAADSLSAYVSAVPDAPDRAAVEADLSSIRKTPGFLDVKTAPPGAAIWVDGVDTSRTAPAEVSVTAGSHVVTAQLEGREPAEQSVTVALGAHQSLALTLPALRPSEVPVQAGEVNPARTNDAEFAGRTEHAPVPVIVPPHPTPPFWIAVGVAAAGAVTGTVFGILALGKQADFDDHPTNGTADAGERDAAIADVAFGISAASGITAAILYFASGKTERPADSTWSIVPAVDAGKLSIKGTARF